MYSMFYALNAQLDVENVGNGHLSFKDSWTSRGWLGFNTRNEQEKPNLGGDKDANSSRPLSHQV